MGDTVQTVLEAMVPELEDLQEKGIFSKEEIRSIVQRRRYFEYQMARRAPRKIDALRYASYEIRLDTLRATRKDTLGLKRHSVSDTAGVRRLHFIFARALRRFKGDVAMWLQYVEFCRRTGSVAVLPKTFAKALQIHPTCETLWVQAASWEFGGNRNAENARVLMQRAIRMNPRAPKLYLEFFRLELLCLARAGPVAGPAKPPRPEGEECEQEEDDDDEGEQDPRQTVLADLASGALPLLIFRSCMEAVAPAGHATLELHASFLGVAEEHDPRFSGRVQAAVLGAIRERFAEDEAAAALLAERPLKVHDRRAAAARAAAEAAVQQGPAELAAAAAAAASARAVALRDTLGQLQQALEQLPTPRMWDRVLDFYEGELAAEAEDSAPHSGGAGVGASAAGLSAAGLLALCERAEAAGGGAALAARRVEVLRRCARGEGADAAADAAAAASARHAADGALCLRRAELLVRGARAPAAAAALRAGAATADEKFPLLARMLDVAVGCCGGGGGGGGGGGRRAAMRDAEAAFLRGVSGSVEPAQAVAAFRAFLAFATYRHGGVNEAARAACRKAMGALSSDSATRVACIKATIDVEQSQLVPCGKAITLLFERLLVEVSDDPDIWQGYIDFERSAGNHEKVNHLIWRRTQLE